MAILFLIIGIGSLGLSAYFFTRKKTPESLVVENIVKSNEEDFDAVNKQKGNDFEDYMIQLVGNEKGVKLVSRNSDYHKNGVSASENMEPDLKFKSNDVPFSIECKWRKSFFNEEVFFAKNYQIRNYNKYQIDRKQKVFVAFGIGGKPNFPEKLFVVPLSKIAEEYIDENEIKEYQVKTADEIITMVNQ
ncbi:hypothetical protein [Kaistella polysaccharea]|uniref:hypothetical protein n=1 Tax=Kaistella polysaccharea TaxID=2878534 RepID=UPI001CF26A52|nr:hypothetical protein [Kaistella polysaccharea]